MQTQTHARADIGEGQRVLSAIGGSLLVYLVTKKHKAESLLLLGGGYLLYRAVSGHCPLSQALQTRHRRTHPSNVNVRTHVIVARPPEEVYPLWRSLENWPLFMRHLANVDELDNNTSAWTMTMPGIGDVRWEANIVRDEKNRELSISSVPGAPIDVTAKINFSPTPGNATRVDVMLSYRAPAGPIGERIARLLTPVLRDKIESDIANFKHFTENLGKKGVE
ncbi:MAG TPA: SRPBCC family protein [Puia sp.]|uniref:SRPBCC family protein n=1 Tax=Puia sp. TaxID=2045100 RepID=UPI002B83ABAA|nr:SRPBCC family protein [Puia sp.]HVU98179.1 SRPBCC family protein [Puia sp.]